LKAWPVAGDRALGRAFLALAGGVAYGPPFDIKSLEEIRTMKRKTDQHMSSRRRGGHNVKLGAGGIREIELVVQSLQVYHGGQIAGVRSRNTLKALNALCAESLISPEERDTLARAYIFLRDVENKLQMVNDAQTHSLPEDEEELAVCARRLGYAVSDRRLATEQFLRDYGKHTANVNRIFESAFGVEAALRFSKKR
jgi:glutamate-ammonia-ligase adenylyltransferase